MVPDTCKLCLFRLSQQGERRRYRGTAFWTTEPSTQFGEGNIPKQLNSVIKVNFPCGIALSAATAILSQRMPTIAQGRKQQDSLRSGSGTISGLTNRRRPAAGSCQLPQRSTLS